MARSLDQLALEIAGQLGEEHSGREYRDLIADGLRQVRPNADAEAVEAAANQAAGYHPAQPSPARARPGGGGRSRQPARRPASKITPRHRAGRRVRRAAREVSGSTFGRVFRSGLYLTGLYWLLRSSGVVGTVAQGTRGALEWLMDPTATVTRRPAPAATVAAKPSKGAK